MEHTRTFDAGELDELISAGRLADVGTTLSAMPAGDIAALLDRLIDQADEQHKWLAEARREVAASIFGGRSQAASESADT